VTDTYIQMKKRNCFSVIFKANIQTDGPSNVRIVMTRLDFKYISSESREYFVINTHSKQNPFVYDLRNVYNADITRSLK